MLTKKEKEWKKAKQKHQTYDPDWLQGMNERDNFEAHYKKVTIVLHSNCLAVAVKGKEVANEQPNLSKDGDQGYRALNSAPGLRSRTYKTRCPAVPTSSQPFSISLVYKLQREFYTLCPSRQ